MSETRNSTRRINAVPTIVHGRGFRLASEHPHSQQASPHHAIALNSTDVRGTANLPWGAGHCMLAHCACQ